MRFLRKVTWSAHLVILGQIWILTRQCSYARNVASHHLIWFLSARPFNDGWDYIKHHLQLLEIRAKLYLEITLQPLTLPIFYIEHSEHNVNELPWGFLPCLLEVQPLIGLFLSPYTFQDFCQIELPLLEKLFQIWKQLHFIGWAFFP